MKLFCKHSVCAECKVLFEPPAPGTIDRMWPNLCEAHRKAPRDKWQRVQTVKNWAEFNFERLEKQMLAEVQEERAKVDETMQRFMQQSMQSQYGAGLRAQQGPYKQPGSL